MRIAQQQHEPNAWQNSDQGHRSQLRQHVPRLQRQQQGPGLPRLRLRLPLVRLRLPVPSGRGPIRARGPREQTRAPTARAGNEGAHGHIGAVRDVDRDVVQPCLSAGGGRRRGTGQDVQGRHVRLPWGCLQARSLQVLQLLGAVCRRGPDLRGWALAMREQGWHTAAHLVPEALHR